MTEKYKKEIQRLTKELELQKEINRQLVERSTAGISDVSSESLNHSLPPGRTKLWSNISHEILTPMDAILGMTDLVMETDLSDEQRNYMEMINASADRLFGVISDIIDYSELCEGNLRRDLLNFDLFEELEYDLYIASLSAKHKDLEFHIEFDRNFPNYVHSDPSRLRQVLNNIVSNALKYTEKGGITVKVEQGGYDDSGKLLIRFTVKDTGIGISPDVLQDIFHHPLPVERTEENEKYSEGGLGLVVSARLVELYGGKIEVDSNEGEGATFRFTWPVVNPIELHMGELPADLFSDKQDRSMVLRGASILLAEDEYINASITQAFLEQYGVDVTVVTNGEEAVDAAGKNCFDAILMDVQMPVVDGLQATKIIRRKERKKNTNCPIIALTAHALHGDREKCMQAGMDDYLPKPLDKKQLIDMLTRYMTKKALIVGSTPDNQHDLIQPLVERGWAVNFAETGKMAMYEASLSHYDLVLIDSSLPALDGHEAVETIRKLEEYSGNRATIMGIGFSPDEEEYTLYKTSSFDSYLESPSGGKEYTAIVEKMN